MSFQCRTWEQRGKAPPGLALVLLLAIAAAAGGAPAAPDWPPFLEPRTGVPPEIAPVVERLWREPTLMRTVRGRPARAPFALYAALVDTPEVTAAAARHRDLARYEVRALDDDRYEADDGDGARGRYRVLRREPSRRVIVSWGEHTGYLLGTITGSALTLLDLVTRDEAVEQTLSAWVHIENPVAAFVARVLIALFGGLADRKLGEGLRVATAIAEWAVADPGEFCAWLAREPLPGERRDRVRAAFSGCATARISP